MSWLCPGCLAVAFLALFPTFIGEAVDFIIDGDTNIHAMSWRAALVGAVALALAGVCYWVEGRWVK